MPKKSEVVHLKLPFKELLQLILIFFKFPWSNIFCWHAIQLVFLPPRSHWGERGWYTVVSLFYDQCLWPQLLYLMVSCEDRSPSLIPPSGITLLKQDFVASIAYLGAIPWYIVVYLQEYVFNAFFDLILKFMQGILPR